MPFSGWLPTHYLTLWYIVKKLWKTWDAARVSIAFSHTFTGVSITRWQHVYVFFLLINVFLIRYSPLHSALSQCFLSVSIPSGSTPGQFFLSVDAQNLSRIIVHFLSQGPQSVQLLHPPLGAVWNTSNHKGYRLISDLPNWNVPDCC